ncbi:unnamed protein product, partial [marine sediment metagenome]
NTLYATPQIDVAIAIKTATSMAEPWFKSEPQNLEGWFRFAQSFLKLIEYIPSTFDIHDSIFDIRFLIHSACLPNLLMEFRVNH